MFFAIMAVVVAVAYYLTYHVMPFWLITYTVTFMVGAIVGNWLGTRSQLKEIHNASLVDGYYEPFEARFIPPKPPSFFKQHGWFGSTMILLYAGMIGGALILSLIFDG